MTGAARKNSIGGEIAVDGQPISWIRDGSLRKRPIYLLAHGAGAPQTSDFMEMVAAGLVGRGITVVRFHFAYMERAVREGKRRPPDRAPRLLQACVAMFDLVNRWLPRWMQQAPPIVVGGKSMGGRMMSMMMSEASSPAAAALVYLGYPLHPAGKPEKLRVAHLSSIAVPQLFVSGTRDALATGDRLQTALEDLGEQATLHLVEAGDHSLSVSRKDPQRGSSTWLDAVANFIHEQTRHRLTQKAGANAGLAES